MTAIQQAPLSNCVLAPVPPGSLIVDTCSPVSAGQARGLRAQNVVGVMRYLGGWASDLTASSVAVAWIV